MRITVRLFAGARDLVGLESLERDLPDGSTVEALKRELATAYPNLASLLRHSMIAIGHEYATDAAVLSDGAEVAVIPPVSGG